MISPVKVDADLALKLKNIGIQSQALQEFIQKVIDSGKAQQGKINADSRELWQEIAKRHKVDITSIVWNFDGDHSIVPIQVTLNK